MTSHSRGPTNLTALAERMPWSKARQELRVLARTDGLILDIRALNAVEEGGRSPDLCDDVYVVISGYGTLQCAGETVEFTAGDVLLAPAGVAHRFERMDGEPRVWRISVCRPAER